VSLRDRIFAVDDLQREIVMIEQWGIEVEVRGMSGAARAAIIQNAASNNGNLDFGKMMPELVISCTFDPETGEQVFDDSDLPNIMSKSGAALDKITTIAMRLSGFGADAVDEAGKGSLLTQNGGSSSN
jgi:hypothetical protein